MAHNGRGVFEDDTAIFQRSIETVWLLMKQQPWFHSTGLVSLEVANLQIFPNEPATHIGMPAAKIAVAACSRELPQPKLKPETRISPLRAMDPKPLS